jgi:hypothetical protein
MTHSFILKFKIQHGLNQACIYSQVSYKYMGLEACNMKICGDIIQGGTQLYVFDDDVTKINQSS